MENEKGTNFGIEVSKLKGDNPKLFARIEAHFGTEYTNWTPGQIQHMDVAYGQADPRVEAGNRARGDFFARGGSGPKR